MRLIIFLIVAPLLPDFALAEIERSAFEKFRSSVVRLRVMTGAGHSSNGSAVVVAPGKLVTNCHVTRDARLIDAIAEGSQQRATEVMRNEHRDLCLLAVEGEFGAVAQLGGAGAVKIGHEVAAVGFAGGQALRISQGHVKGLYAHDGARVIRSSAPFALGQSGGGLFDREGRLVGILAFKARNEGAYFFALPVQWIEPLLHAQAGDAARPSAVAFWEEDADRLPWFLRAAALEIGEDWSALLALAKDWAQAEPGDAESWLALGKAYRRLRRAPDAEDALRKAVDLDPRHSEGWLYLGAVYRESAQTQRLDEVKAVLSDLDPEALKALIRSQ